MAELGDSPEVKFCGEVRGVGIFGGSEESGGFIPAGLAGGVDGFSEVVEAFEGIWGEGIFGAKEFVNFFWGGKWGALEEFEGAGFDGGFGEVEGAVAEEDSGSVGAVGGDEAAGEFEGFAADAEGGVEWGGVGGDHGFS